MAVSGLKISKFNFFAYILLFIKLRHVFQFHLITQRLRHKNGLAYVSGTKGTTNKKLFNGP